MDQRIAEFVKAHQEDIVNDWRDLVNLEGSLREPQYLYPEAEWLKEKFTEAGVKCEIISTADNYPPLVCGTIGEERPGVPVIFAGHFDTVFNKGTYGDNPFRIDEDGKAHGPGVLDMKGGIIIALWTIKALESTGYNERPIRVCWCSDEEGGTDHGPVSKLITEWTSGCIAGFNMETSPVDWKLCVGRKYIFSGKAVFHGISAHSGNNYEAGRNAIVEAAYKVIAIQNMNNMELGTHMNPAIIAGGRMPNSIPDECTLTFSGRFKTKAEIARVREELKELFSKTEIDGCSIEYTLSDPAGGFEASDKNMALWSFVNDVCKAEGFHEVDHVFLGGGSDASGMAESGTPVLCSCGVRGEWNHTDREYAVVDSMFERVNMWSNVVMHLDEFKLD